MQFSDSVVVEGGGTYVARFAGATGACQWATTLGVHTNVVAANATGVLVVAGDYGDEMVIGTDSLPYSTSGYYQPVVAAFAETVPLLRSLSATTAAPGTIITLRGRQFTGATQVLLAGVQVQFAVVNANTIRFTVPSVALGGSMTVTTPNGTGRGVYFATSAPTGLASDADPRHLLVWPNPAGGGSVVRLTLPTPSEVEGTIADALGRVVRRFAPRPAEATVLLAPLPAGIYSVRYGSATARLVVE
jgi:hypothetical protein